MRVIDLTTEELEKVMKGWFYDCLKCNFEQKKESENKTEGFLTITEVASFLSLSVPTIYALTSKKEIPHLKRGKRLYFLKTDIHQYLEQGRKKTKEDVLNSSATNLNTLLSNKK